MNLLILYIHNTHAAHTCDSNCLLCDAYLDNVNCFISAIRNNRTFKGASYLKRSFPTVTANRLYEAIRMLLIVKLQFQVMSVKIIGGI